MASEGSERLRASLPGLEPDDARELLAEARSRARSRVMSMLVDAYADAMLDDALIELRADAAAREGPGRRVSDAGASRPGAQSTELGFYVYGVLSLVEARAPASVAGVDPAHETIMIEHGTLGAIVSRVPLDEFDEEPLRERLTDMRWLEQTARAHEDVLELIGRGRTLIPMRICSIYRTEAGLREMLEREADSLCKALDHLDGRTEWGVKVFADRDAAAPPAAAAGPSQAGGESTGTAYLFKRRQEREQGQRLDEALEDACREIHGTLSSRAADSLCLALQRPEVSGHPGEMVFNGAYLVDDSNNRQFSDELERLGSRFVQLGLELVLTGPWPAYNFVPDTIGASL